MNVTLDHLTKRFGDQTVVTDVNLAIPDGELFFLLGPSGCGKTTLLRMVAGFYAPDAGTIRFDDRVMNDVPPHRRNTGLVFQNYALWPHLSVADNVGYGLDVRGITGAERARRVAAALATVRMAEYAARMTTQLSGGQQQRVALARALVIQPGVLLLDEPLSNLDAKLRLEMREEIRRIHAETGLTTLYVTHDQQEALSLADRIAVMRDGRLEQAGTPRELYRTPRNRFVAGFMGQINFVPGTVLGPGRVATAAGEFQTTADAATAGTAVTLGVRPESIRVVQPTRDGCATFTAEIVAVNYLGDVEQYVLRLPGGVEWQAAESNPAHVRRVGEKLEVGVRPGDVLVLES